jgi:arylsulfatase A-like enzyme
MWIILLGIVWGCTGTEERSPGEVVEVSETLQEVHGIPLEIRTFPSSIGRAHPLDRGQLKEHPDIVLVVIDTLRADHLSLYGHSRLTSPNLDAIGRDGVWFSRAYAHSGWTLPSFSSLFSGLLPHQHGVGRDRTNIHLFGRLRPEVQTLAELLADGGYRTAAVMNNTFLAPEFGLSQGFESYLWQGASNQDFRSAKDTVDEGMAWLDTAEQPAFLVLHFMEPHANYDPREAVRHRFTKAGEAPVPVPFTYQDGQREEPYSELDIEYLKALYDEEILDADLGVGHLVQSLRDRNSFDQTVLVVTSDHGEEFWDHGRFEHGQNLHSELTRVPLVMHGPGLMGGEVDVVVEHLDLFETLLELGGMESPVPAGESLLGLLEMLSDPSYGAQLARRTAVADNTLYGPPRVSITDYGARMLLDQARGRAEVWKVDEDGLERRQLSGSQQQTEYERLQSRIFARRGNLEPLEVDSSTGFVMDDSEIFEQLQTLGYLEP